MAYKTLIYQKKGQLGEIILNRSKAKNAIDVRLAEELADACLAISQDKDIRAVSIMGAGQAFCIGTDFSEKTDLELRSVANVIDKLGCPVIAAINGDAIGQGLELALACDLRVAAETARLGMPQISSGLIPWDGGTQRLPRLVGKSKALEMILLGEAINAQEAYRIGLVNKVVRKDELSTVVAEIARGIADKAPIALRYAKEAIKKGLDLTLEQGLRLEADLYLLLHTTRDRTAGIKSFQQKAKMEFKGE